LPREKNGADCRGSKSNRDEVDVGGRHGTDLDRLITEGRVTAPTRSDLPEPLKLAGDPRALSQALDDIRGS
jgi:hypothetical protein